MYLIWLGRHEKTEDRTRGWVKVGCSKFLMTSETKTKDKYFWLRIVKWAVMRNPKILNYVYVSNH